jgi:hypothetical protein
MAPSAIRRIVAAPPASLVSAVVREVLREVMVVAP